MKNFLLILLTSSITMSLISLLFIAITPLLSRRYSVKWCYYAWFIIIMGLIIPFRLQFDSAFIQVKMPTIHSTITQFGAVQDTGIDTATANITLTNLIQTTNFNICYEILGCIWLIGTITVILYRILQHARFMKMIERWSEDIDTSKILENFQKLKAEMGISSKLILKSCSCITSPMMVGFTKSFILLPTTEYLSSELTFILKHELTHFKRKDIWYKALVMLATAIHWFNPAIYLIAKIIAVQCEISCDEEVVLDENIQVRKLYSEAIINIVRKGSKFQTILSTNFYGGEKGMKKRIFSIMDTTKKKKGIAIIFCVIIAVMTTGIVFAKTNNKKLVDRSGTYESNVPISEQEKANIAQKHKKEVAKTYLIYAKYGLTYDDKKDRFFYNGKMVRFFLDKLDEKGHYNSFSYYDGIVDIKAVRNAQNELTGIIFVSQEEYDKRTKLIQNAKNSSKGAIQENLGGENKKGVIQENLSKENKNSNSSSTTQRDSGITNNGVTKELGDSDYVDNALNAYLKYGVSYDKNNKKWLFQNKPIHFLNDGDNFTFVDNSENAVKNGILVKVVRTSDNEIEKLIQMDPSEFEEIKN